MRLPALQALENAYKLSFIIFLFRMFCQAVTIQHNRQEYSAHEKQGVVEPSWITV